jgi:sRNA-binding regulator protein Hfq
MDKEDLKEFNQKNVKIFLRNGFIYTGKVKAVRQDTIDFFDKFRCNLKIMNQAIQQVILLEGEEDEDTGTNRRG